MTRDDRLDQALERYEDRFDDQYPLMALQAFRDKDVIEDIDRRIEEGRPMVLDDGRTY